MSKGYTGTLIDGRGIYIPSWSVKVQYENLTQACKYLGQDRVIEISTLNVPAAMLAIMSSEDAKASTELLLHFTQQANIDGDKITDNNLDDLGMDIVIEIFAHVMYSQYNDFFESGLAKAHSQNKSKLDKND